MKMTGTEAINQGVYGFYLADRARQLAAELDALTPPGSTRLDCIALARWAGETSVVLKLIADEFAGPLPKLIGHRVTRADDDSPYPVAGTIVSTEPGDEWVMVVWDSGQSPRREAFDELRPANG